MRAQQQRLRWKWVLTWLAWGVCAVCAEAQLAGTAAVANPGRPTVSTPATLTPVGYLQFESGPLHAWRSPEFTFEVNFNETVKLAVAERLQLIVGIEPFARAKAGSQLQDGFGGIAVGGQAVMHSGQGMNPTVAVSYMRQLNGGSAPDLDIGSSNDSVVVLISADVLGFHYDTNGVFSRANQNDVNRAQFGQTLSVSHPVVGAFGAAGEIWHFNQPFLHGDAVGTLWALNYNERQNLVWDAGFDRGLTGSSTQWEVFAGFTYLLPHRLWKGSKRAEVFSKQQPTDLIAKF